MQRLTRVLSRPPSKLVLKMLTIGCKWKDSQSVHFISPSIIGQAVLGPRRYVWFRQRRIFQHGWWDEISGMRWLRERSNRLPRHQRGKQAMLCSPIKSQPHIRILRLRTQIYPIRWREMKVSIWTGHVYHDWRRACVLQIYGGWFSLYQFFIHLIFST